MLNGRTNIVMESIQMSNPQSCHYLSMNIDHQFIVSFFCAFFFPLFFSIFLLWFLFWTDGCKVMHSIMNLLRITEVLSTKWKTCVSSQQWFIVKYNTNLLKTMSSTFCPYEKFCVTSFSLKLKRKG